MSMFVIAKDNKTAYDKLCHKCKNIRSISEFNKNCSKIEGEH